MPTPVIHDYYCSDHHPIEEWEPDDPANVDVWIDFCIGPDNETSGEIFSVNVITYDALKNARRRKRYLCVLDEYSWPAVVEWVQETMAKCRGRDWLAMVEKLRDHLWWEYEGIYD